MTAFDPDIFELVCNTIVTEFGISPHRLTPDTAMVDLDLDQQEYDTLYSILSEETGVSLHDVYSTMPVLNYGENEKVMSSLRNIAPFNRFAADYLERCDVQPEKETVGSIAASFTEGKYVRSGLTFPPTLPPHAPLNVLFRLVGLPLLFVVFVPYLYTLMPCNPFAWYCGWTMTDRLGDVVKVLCVISTLYVVSALWPGLSALRYRKARLARRGANR